MVEEPGTTESPLIPQLIAIGLRRKWTIIIPFLLAAVATVYVCIALPPVYRSETTILVEPQQVPQDYVQSTVTGSVTDRLSTIGQQILSRTRLESVIRDLNLYPDMRKAYPMEDVVNKMRENVEIEVVEDKNSPRRGESSAAAFKLAFMGREPEVVQRVTGTLANLYIEENLKVREGLARGTKEFLDREVRDVEQELAHREEAIREFRQNYMGELPEQLETNLRTLDQLQLQKNAVLDSLRQADDRLFLIERQIEQTPMSLTEMVADQDDLYTVLEAKKQALAALTSRYTELYPDVVTLKKEIAEIEARIAGNPDNGDKPAPEAAPEPAQEPASDSPAAAAVEQPASESAPDSAPTPAPAASVNPAYERLASQLQSDRLTAKSLRAELADVNARMQALQRRVENIPKREQELMSLKRDYETIKQSYDSLMERKINAAIAENLETRQKSERFRILDPANLPQRPVKPDRRKILAIGLLLGLGLGGGLAYIREQMDDTFHTLDEIKAFVAGVPILGVIPLVVPPEEIRRKRILVAASATAGAVCLAALIVGVHVYVKRIDVLVVDFVKMFLV
jgi:polysaccharide chain length determinant protein (PEP-CTERM system associated)